MSTKQQKVMAESRPKSDRRKTQPSSVLNHQAAITVSQSLPLVVGNTYIKVENIDLEELSVFIFF